MRNAWGSSDDTPTTALGMVVRIKTSGLIALPNSTKLAKQIRDTILRDEFDYNDAEIAEFNIKYVNDLVIGIEGNLVIKWADDYQVKSWKAEKDGLVPITLTEIWIKAVRNFRGQRISNILGRAVGEISDAQIRTKVLGDLEKILNLSGDDRLNAVRDLATLDSANGELATALDYLLKQDGYAENPFLLIARAKIDTLGYMKKIGPGFDALIPPMLGKAIQKAGETFTSDTAKRSSSISREEAAYINREASWMFAQIGREKDFLDRDWLARIYVMTDAERESVREGEPLHFTAPGPAAMSTPRPLTDAEKLHDSNENNWQLTQEEWANQDESMRAMEPTDPRSTDRTEITLKTTVTTEAKGSSSPNRQKKDAFPRGQNQRRPVPGKISVTTDNIRISPDSVEKANMAGGMVDLFSKWQNAITFRVRIEIVTGYIADRDNLERKIAAERVTVVPPKPEEIEKMIADVRQYGRTGGQFEKQEAMRIISKLKQIRERSYAMWKTKR